MPLDAWVIEREVLDPLAYAELWVRDGGTVPGSAAYARLVEAWLDDFAARGVTAIGFGYVLLRRPPSGDAPTLARYERIGQSLGDGPLGSHLARRSLPTIGWRRWMTRRSRHPSSSSRPT